MINFTWNATQYQSPSLQIKLNFSHVPEISPNHIQDTLVVHFKDENVFFSRNLSSTLHESSLTLFASIPRQVKDTKFERTVHESAAQATRGAKIMFLIGLALNLVFFGGSHYMTILIRLLQIILHLPMLFTPVPGNVISTFKVLISIAMFDILENDYGIGPELFLEFDEEGQERISDDIMD